ncbi:MAG: chemotaxis protein [Wolinella sp.]
MTQEELDSLMMSGGMDPGEGEMSADSGILESLGSSDNEESEGVLSEELEGEYDAAGYRVNPTKSWPPPPPTEDHKVVSQLDDVTRDSEVKAGEVFDKLETISNDMMDIEKSANEVKQFIVSQREMLEKLHERFPTIKTFEVALSGARDAEGKAELIINAALNSGDTVMSAMDIMQYQDIHRQKIERVINVMRALAKYMNSLFEGKVDDTKRVASATHIHGDTSTEDVVSDDDIEALIASFGGK